jgi:uncharacterized YigZ family protein
MEKKPYKTLLRAAKDELVINKSRFLCRGFPVESEEEALKCLAEVRAAHQDATHNCYAYAVGANMGIMRYSDDGEPGGTAGLPMMEVIKARCVTNCIVVVTRYFGGILLGAGGLARAYARGVRVALEAAGVTEFFLRQRLSFSVSYAAFPKVENELTKRGVPVLKKEFGERVFLEVLCDDASRAALDAFLLDLTSGAEKTSFVAFEYAK